VSQSRVLEANAPRQRIAYVYKQYPKQPFIVLDLIRTVARRIDFDQWRYLVVEAAKQAHEKLYEDMEDVALLTQDGSRIAVTPSMWQRYMSAQQDWIEYRAGGAEKFRETYSRVVGAIVEMVGAEELPEWIWEYLRENSYRNDALKDVVDAAFMFSKMLPNEEKRDGYRLPPSSQLAFPFRGEPKARPLPPLPGKVKVPAEDRALFHQAWAWVQSGWDDRDYYDEAIEWWVRHFRPDEALIYAFDLGQYGKSNQTEVPYDVAEALRDHGINAWEVEDAVPYISRTLNLHNAEELSAQVEKAKKAMLPNRARRASRPRGRR